VRGNGQGSSDPKPLPKSAISGAIVYISLAVAVPFFFSRIIVSSLKHDDRINAEMHAKEMTNFFPMSLS